MLAIQFDGAKLAKQSTKCVKRMRELGQAKKKEDHVDGYIGEGSLLESTILYRNLESDTTASKARVV